MAYIDATTFVSLHPTLPTLADSPATFPSATQFAAWVTEMSDLVNDYLNVDSDITDTRGTVKRIVDRLCWVKYLNELAAKNKNPLAIAGLPQPMLTGPEMITLDRMKNSVTGAGNDRVAATFNIEDGSQVG